jgi:hypothetical protein
MQKINSIQMCSANFTVQFYSAHSQTQTDVDRQPNTSTMVSAVIKTANTSHVIMKHLSVRFGCFLLHHTHTWCICPIATVRDRFGGLGDTVRLDFHNHKWVLCCLIVNFVHLTREPRFDVTQWNVWKEMEKVLDQSGTIKNQKMSLFWILKEIMLGFLNRLSRWCYTRLEIGHQP